MVIGENTIVFEGKKRYYIEDLIKASQKIEL